MTTDKPISTFLQQLLQDNKKRDLIIQAGEYLESNQICPTHKIGAELRKAFKDHISPSTIWYICGSHKPHWIQHRSYQSGKYRGIENL